METKTVIVLNGGERIRLVDEQEAVVNAMSASHPGTIFQVQAIGKDGKVYAGAVAAFAIAFIGPPEVV